MVLKISTMAVILLATLMVAGSVRIRPGQGKERDVFEKLAQIAAHHDESHSKKPVDEDNRATSAADGLETNSAGTPVIALESPAAFAQEAAAQSSVLPSALNVTIRKQLGAVPNEPPSKRLREQGAEALPSNFAKTLDYVKSANVVSQVTILKAACDWSAFSCEEIIQLANSSTALMKVPCNGAVAAELFAQQRNFTGCISDPANAKSIVDFYQSKFPFLGTHDMYSAGLKEAFIDNEGLNPAKDVGQPPMQLQMGRRTGEDMEKLLGDMRELQLIKAAGSEGAGGLCELGNRTLDEYHSRSLLMSTEFLSWLNQIGPRGEQFSGSQMVNIVETIPEYCMSPQLVSAVLRMLEQHMMGVTCEEVKQIMTFIMPWIRRSERGENRANVVPSSLASLKSSIVDGQNKLDIIAFVDSLFFQRFPTFGWPMPLEVMVNRTGEALQDLVVGLPPMNNPVFGVVKGNPVIFVVDKSTSMDANFTLGDDTFTRRKFCNAQLEAVLEGLPNGTYFNVIQYSSSAVQIFQTAVLVSKTNIDAAMEAIGTTWRASYSPHLEPREFLRTMQVFALKFKPQSTKRNSFEALKLAYDTAHFPGLPTVVSPHLPSKQIDLRLVNAALHRNRGLPQIYFLTSGQPDGGASQILGNIDVFDKGRKIPINSIAFIAPADLAAKQFVKELANKTGGFSRSIEQTNLDTHKRKREPSDKSAPPTERDVQESTESESKHHVD